MLGLGPTYGKGSALTKRQWAVRGLGDYSEIDSEELQTWVNTSKRALQSAGVVEAFGVAAGERVTIRMNPGETWLVR